jgi:hypothetical protein
LLKSGDPGGRWQGGGGEPSLLEGGDLAGEIAVPAKPPESIKRSPRSRLIAHAHERWPDLTNLTVRHRGQFAYAYVDGELRNGTTARRHDAPTECPTAIQRIGQHLGLAIHLAS